MRLHGGCEGPIRSQQGTKKGHSKQRDWPGKDNDSEDTQQVQGRASVRFYGKGRDRGRGKAQDKLGPSRLPCELGLRFELLSPSLR